MELINEQYWLADYTFSLGASVFLVGLLNLKMRTLFMHYVSLTWLPLCLTPQFWHSDRIEKKKKLRKFSFCILDLQEIQG